MDWMDLLDTGMGTGMANNDLSTLDQDLLSQI